MCRGRLTTSGAPRHTLVRGSPSHYALGALAHFGLGAAGTLWFGEPILWGGWGGARWNDEIIKNRSLCHTSPPSHLRSPAALTPDKNLFFRDLFHNLLLIMVYKMVYKNMINPNSCHFQYFFFFTVIIGFSFFWSDGAPLQVGALGTCL